MFSNFLNLNYKILIFKSLFKDHFIIENYCREPGVRSLKKFAGKICEKIAFKIANENPSGPIIVKPKDLEDYIGP